MKTSIPFHFWDLDWLEASPEHCRSELCASWDCCVIWSHFVGANQRWLFAAWVEDFPKMLFFFFTTELQGKSVCGFFGGLFVGWLLLLVGFDFFFLLFVIFLLCTQTLECLTLSTSQQKHLSLHYLFTFYLSLCALQLGNPTWNEDIEL